jgi:glycosyltransferase involved in cell wall biosynthesis
MNSLFIGPYRQDDGWGMSARDYIKSIATQTENITTRPYFYTGQSVEVSEDIAKYEKNVYPKYDVIYQELLPQSMCITDTVKKNVGIFNMEITNLADSICQNILNNLDLVCVPSKQEAKSVKESGVKTKCKVISGALDLDFLKENADHKLFMQKSIDRSFKFYYIGEFVERKNLADVVTAFNLAFRDNENVSLIIKTSVPGKSTGEGQKIVKQALNQHKQMLNIGKTRDEFVITERLSDKDLVGLHNACDCFVMASHGEAFCRPAAEALVLGSTPIVTDHTGMTDFVNKKNGFVISSQKTPVIAAQRTLASSFDIYNANSYWYRPNIYVMIEHMRTVYEMSKKERKTLEEKRQIGRESMDQFSYQTIGKKICN